MSVTGTNETTGVGVSSAAGAGSVPGCVVLAVPAPGTLATVSSRCSSPALARPIPVDVGSVALTFSINGYTPGSVTPRPEPSWPRVSGALTANPAVSPGDRSAPMDRKVSSTTALGWEGAASSAASDTESGRASPRWKR